MGCADYLGLPCCQECGDRFETRKRAPFHRPTATPSHAFALPSPEDMQYNPRLEELHGGHTQF